MELLVVIAIIAVLVALLLPSLRQAKLRAKDIACMSGMRQGLTAVFVYNGDFTKGLTNYHPRCQWWGKSWLVAEHSYSNGSLVFSQDPFLLSPGPNDTWRDLGQYPSHGGSEGGSLDNWWRGYLLAGKYATVTTLGCNFTDYRGSAFFRGPHRLADGWGQACNQIEWDRTCTTFRQYPAFVWWGPGTVPAKVNACHEFQIDTSSFADSPVGSDTVCTDYRGSRGPLLTCPRACLTEYWNSYYWWDASTHRPDQIQTKCGVGVTNLYQYGYAQNVGYSDGAVRFFFGIGPAKYDPFRR